MVVGIDGETLAGRTVILPRREDEASRAASARDLNARAGAESRAEAARHDHLVGDIRRIAPRGAVVRRGDHIGARLGRVGVRLDPTAAEYEDPARSPVGHGRGVHESVAAAVGRPGQVGLLGPRFAVVGAAPDHDVRVALVHPRVVARLAEHQQRAVGSGHHRGNTVRMGARSGREGSIGLHLRKADRPFGSLRPEIGHHGVSHRRTLDFIVCTGGQRKGRSHQTSRHQQHTQAIVDFRFHYRYRF